MWSQVLEWCADIFGATKRSRWLSFLVALCGALCVSALFGARWGLWRALVPLALLLVAAPYVARGAVRAREGLWRAACLDLADPRQRPPSSPGAAWLLPPTAAALGRLALAVDLVRREGYAEAIEIVSRVDRDRALLRDDEARLLEAARALISLGLGDPRRAAQQAVLALPSGSEPIDMELGRAVVADAWGDTKRLLAIDAAWEKEGVAADQEGALPRLRALVKLRVLGGDMSALGPAEARALADEARAIGDEDLGADLDVQSRTGGYR